MTPAARELTRLAAVAVIVLAGVAGVMLTLWGPGGIVVTP